MEEKKLKHKTRGKRRDKSGKKGKTKRNSHPVNLFPFYYNSLSFPNPVTLFPLPFLFTLFLCTSLNKLLGLRLNAYNPPLPPYFLLWTERVNVQETEERQAVVRLCGRILFWSMTLIWPPSTLHLPSCSLPENCALEGSGEGGERSYPVWVCRI